jgi:hypothetical protein
MGGFYWTSLGVGVVHVVDVSPFHHLLPPALSFGVLGILRRARYYPPPSRVMVSCLFFFYLHGQFSLWSLNELGLEASKIPG